eukprot:scaffold597_cov176-Amphora_coffeaeformis.AAC.19
MEGALTHLHASLPDDVNNNAKRPATIRRMKTALFIGSVLLDYLLAACFCGDKKKSRTALRCHDYCTTSAREAVLGRTSVIERWVLIWVDKIGKKVSFGQSGGVWPNNGGAKQL